MVVTGTVSFERLPIGGAGLGPGLVTLPARFVDVELTHAFASTCYGQASTDATGAFTILANPPAGTTLKVVAYSRTDYDALRNVTVHNALPPFSNAHTNADCFSSSSAQFPAGVAQMANVLVPYNPGNLSTRPAIGFGALDVLVTCAERIRASTGETPPLCHAYTQLGNAGSTGTSFYNDGAKALTLLGGMAGQLDTSDTDYFDDGVIAHEYGHFVEFNMSATRNRGGQHNGTMALEPSFSWSEGAATGWGALLRQDPTYIDTVGTSPQAPLISRNVEDWTPMDVAGIGGEETVSEIVWDLVDGTAGVPDTDGDGVATAFGSLYAQFLAYDGSQVVPYIGTLLDRAVSPVGVPAASITMLMGAPENQQISYPLAGADLWPVPLAVPGMAGGSCTTIGDNTGTCTALASSVWHSFTLGAPTTLTFTLTIGPTGGDGDNLDLFLETFPGAPVGQSTLGGASTETIGPILLAAGKYVVRVQASCGNSPPNAALFTLVVN
jgi:hypothetical protein